MIILCVRVRVSQVYNWMELYAHHMGAMLGEGQLGYLYVQQLRKGHL